MKKWMGMLACLTIIGSVMGCSSEKTTTSKEKKEPVKITQVTNWFAEPEHGGNYTALKKDYYKDEGIDMTIEQGGPQISPIQVVASGKAQFGIVQADDILLARDQGIPVVALAAIFQTNPQGILFHKGQDIKSFSDLNGRNVITAPGVGYWEYIKKAYKLDNVKESTYTGQLTTFINDPTAASQCYITAEPYALQQQGVEVDYLMIHDSGYQPYANVIFTTEKMLKEQPEVVEAYMKATLKGWDYYKENSEEMNPFLQTYNKDITIDALTYGTEKQESLIWGGDASSKGIGYMSEERWSKLQSQLLDLKLLKKKEDIKNAYTVDYLK